MIATELKIKAKTSIFIMTSSKVFSPRNNLNKLSRNVKTEEKLSECPPFSRSSRQECKNQSEGCIFTFVRALQKYAPLIFALQSKPNCTSQHDLNLNEISSVHVTTSLILNEMLPYYISRTKPIPPNSRRIPEDLRRLKPPLAATVISASS